MGLENDHLRPAQVAALRWIACDYLSEHHRLELLKVEQHLVVRLLGHHLEMAQDDQVQSD